MGRKKPGRKAEPGPKRGISWPSWTGFRGMTVRDWLQLLIVPFAFVVIGFVLTMQQDARQQQAELVQRVEGREPIVSLQHADLSGADLFIADLRGAVLAESDLRDANLSSADLDDALLAVADLRGADLTNANLTDANLTDANLEAARGVTDEQVEQTLFLEGATMPNGQKYEDWLNE